MPDPKILPFGSMTACPKCGGELRRHWFPAVKGNRMGPAYAGAVGEKCQFNDFVPEEHHLCTCQVCKFQWLEYPKDQGQP